MKSKNVDPLIPASVQLPELTFRAIVISIVLAIILAASNAYLALKIGTTISASIPASVLALGILRFFKNSNVLESNIIQTAASAGEGIAAAVAFILPALIILGLWKGFPYWETLVISMVGGLLGVLFSVPLRRVLLNMPTLRFPEGTAIGNVLRTATSGKHFLKYLVQGGVVGGFISFAQSGLQIMADSVQMWRIAANTVFGLNIGLTPATLAAGYIIGFEVGLSLLIGILLGWVVLLPIVGWIVGIPIAQNAYDAAMMLWSDHLRFVGVGTMLVGGLWTLLRLLKPVINGLRESFRAFKQMDLASRQEVLRTEKDISILWVVLGVCFLAVIVFGLILYYAGVKIGVTHHAGTLLSVAFCTILYLLLIGFLLATICGYFTGLIGSTNNPLSGILIIGILLLASLYLLIFKVGANNAASISALVIVVATMVAAIASISNENIQDLKAGQMVGATPWKQQLMLAIGVIASTAIIGPVLDLLFRAYGMAGVFPHEGMDPSQMLGAPQASLMAAVTKGVLTHQLNWNMILIGVGVAVIVIIADEIVKRWNFRLPALAVGLAIYLPPEIMTPIVIGSFVNFLVKRQGEKLPKTAQNEERIFSSQQRGILLACGMVAGSALMGVVLAIPFVMMGSSNALAIVSSGFKSIATFLGIAVLALLCFWFHRLSSCHKEID